ncbi:MAG: DUF4007 family protein [Gammaproteobacteria bacterium]|nr:DUF4007 family protein [Gammaproteobacteria bacterium]
MRLERATVSFGRHESFPLRFGWIAKGLNALSDDPRIFNREDATVVLGVGKNMVASIRHWLQATGVAAPVDASRTLAPTQIGQIVFGKGGDPYLEDEATIWLLHWLLATNPAGATAIYWFFNHFHKPTFTSAEVATGLSDFAKHDIGPRVAQSTLKGDAQLVLRMYSRTQAGTRLTLEDALDSPLAALNLQERLDARNWRAVPMDRTDLPLSIFAYAVVQLFDHTGAPHLAVEDLMYSDKNHCAPGAVFRMTEDGLITKLEALCDAYPRELQLNRTAGVFQLYKLGTMDPLQILRDRYARPSRRLAA